MKTLITCLLLLMAPFQMRAQNPLFAWAKQVGNAESESGNAIAIDGAGNVYTTGRFKGTVDFDPGAGTFNLSSNNDYNIFILKLGPAGNFLWAKQCSSANGIGSGGGISIDGSGSIYITGYFTGDTDFDPGAGNFNLSANTQEIFVLKLTGNGNFDWACQLGHLDMPNGSGTGKGNAIGTDQSGNVYVAGGYHGLGDFDPGPAVFNLGTGSAASFLFICKLSGSGNLIWANATTGGSFSETIALAVENDGAIYVTGGFNGSTDFDPGPGTFLLTSTTIPSTNIFLFKWKSDAVFAWAKMMAGGPGYGAAVVTDNSGNIYSTGKFAGVVDFDPGPLTHNLAYTGTANIYISRLNSNGDYVGASQMGGNSDSEGSGIGIDNGGNVYITGSFSGTVDFDPGIPLYNLSANGGTDFFVAKLNSIGNLTWAVHMGGNANAHSNALVTDNTGNVYTTGYFNGRVDFDFGNSNYNLNSNGLNDLFVHKISNCSNSSNTILDITACNAYLLNGQTYTSSGTYLQNLVNQSGCDSLVTLHLTIGKTESIINRSACESFTWNGRLYTSGGIFKDTLAGMGGCDSVLILNLIITQKKYVSINAVICPGEEYEGYRTTGSYIDIFSLPGKCDSIRILHLSIKPTCIPYSIPNAFTPNGDALNEQFSPVINESFSGYRFTIYNRFGIKIFDSRRLNEAWDGNYKGNPQPTGTYIFIFQYTNGRGAIINQKGTFTLFR